MHFLSAIALSALIGSSTVTAGVLNHPAYAPVAGMTKEQLEIYQRSIRIVGSQPPPPLPTDTSYKLVYDEAHPFVKPMPTDQRGPCPALNVLASHGYLPHDGITTPAQLINAAVDGLNMGWTTATLITYGSFLMNGNQLTNLMSIGGLSSKTGPPPQPPAHAGGLNVHNTFEGDASLTRSDDFIGDNHNLNITLFNHMVDYMNQFGNGSYNIHAAAEYRYARIQESIATNPYFVLGNPRYVIAYSDASLTLETFSNDSTTDWERGVSLENIKSFYVEEKFPEGFHRRGSPFNPASGNTSFDFIQAAHPVAPGMNMGTVNSYTPVDFNQGETNPVCALYNHFVSVTVDLYPDPSAELRQALAGNIHNLYQAVKDIPCTELFPFN
ncbi:heme-thiolate peroxidase [Auriculariales sp. MPI-PUGE-AT-0066]|nr:heme-thiolate peroxidase [Auriculariales sp. MPI-PUGE-AT-0066]